MSSESGKNPFSVAALSNLVEQLRLDPQRRNNAAAAFREDPLAFIESQFDLSPLQRTLVTEAAGRVETQAALRELVESFERDEPISFVPAIHHNEGRRTREVKLSVNRGVNGCEVRISSSVAHALTPLNIEGVFATPALPHDFDINTATKEDFVRLGLPWRKPDSKSSAGQRSAWSRVFEGVHGSRKRIVPECTSNKGVVHGPGPRPKVSVPRVDLSGQQVIRYSEKVFAGASTQAGNADGSYSWTLVSGKWKVPTISRPSGVAGVLLAATWVGLSDARGGGLLQAGVASEIYDSGLIGYSAFYEWYVDPPPAGAYPPGTPPYVYETFIKNMTVSPGDDISVSVSYASDSKYGSIWMWNETTGVYFSVDLAPPPGAKLDGSYAQWILESSDSLLPQFTPINFISATACEKTGTLVNELNSTSIADMVSKSNAQSSARVMTVTAIDSSQVLINYAPEPDINLEQ